MSEKKPIITVKGLKTHFPVKGTKKVVRAVDGVDLVIYEGETLPDDIVCPLCKHGATDFEPLS